VGASSLHKLTQAPQKGLIGQHAKEIDRRCIRNYVEIGSVDSGAVGSAAKEQRLDTAAQEEIGNHCKQGRVDPPHHVLL
jgi:hypothetical protein